MQLPFFRVSHAFLFSAFQYIRFTILRRVIPKEEIYNSNILTQGDSAMPKKYPFEFKAKVVRRYQNGETIKSLAPELYIAQGTLYRWRKEYCSI